MVGLTPPAWWVPEQATGASRTKRDKHAAIQRGMWAFWESTIAHHGPFDALLVNGDVIDGRGERSGGTELITSDREEQTEIAVTALRKATNAKTKVVMTYGTAYHTGDGEDWENLVAVDLDAKIGAHEWIDVEGVVFDLKHHIGSSAVPHTRHTAVARDHLWNVLWSDRQQAPKADVTVRSHVHYFNYCGGPGWLGLTTPAMQGWGSKYGSRRCSGIVDVGLVIFECNKGSYSWKPILAPLKGTQASVTRL